MKYYSIDRFEGDFVICVDDLGKCEKIPTRKIPKKAKEGYVLKLLKNGTYCIDFEETERRKKEMSSLQDDIFSE